MKSEHRYYLLSAICLGVGLFLAYDDGSVPIALVSLVFAVLSGAQGKKTETRVRHKQKLIDELLRDRSELRNARTQYEQDAIEARRTIRQERNKKEKLREEKLRENRRLRNLKRVLQRKGIDTEYLVDKYGDSLYAPLMVLTHFSYPENNTEEGAQFIKDKLKELDTQTLHGSARIVPPRNFEQDIRTEEGLKTWFDENVLGGQTDLAHKLEALAVVDVGRTFDRDASVDRDGPDFKTSTISDLFEDDTVVPTEGLLNILSRSDRISLEEELRNNIALLVVPTASEEQMGQVLESQSELETLLGDVTQIAQTPVEDIKDAFTTHGVDDAEELAQNASKEAQRLRESLSF